MFLITFTQALFYQKKENIKQQINMEKTYWTMKNGQKIDVDTMDVQHLRNTLKMIIKNQVRVHATSIKPKFEIHGEIAQNFIEQMLEEDYNLDYDDGY